MPIRIIKYVRILIAVVVIGGAVPHISAEDARPGDPPAAPQPVTRIYDIHPWTAPMFDLSFESSPHSAAFVTPANIQSGNFDHSAAGQRYFSRGARGRPTPEERIENLVKLITDTVAPESWRDKGGTIGAIRQINDALVVIQTPENQNAIAALLGQLNERKGQCVRTSAEWLILPRDDVSKILKTRAPGDKGNRSPSEIDTAALARLPATTRRFHADLLCLNDQTISFISGRERTITVSQTPTIGTAVACYQPLIGNSGTGIALQIHPLIDREEKQAIVTFFSTFNVADNPSPPIHVRAAAVTTQPTAGQSVMTWEASATYRESNGLVQKIRTTVRLPLGVPVLVGSMTLEPTAKNAEANELVMILSVQAAE